MNVKNIALGTTLSTLDSLKGLFLEGDVALAIVDLRNQIEVKLNLAEKAMMSVAESLCTKDDDGKPVKETKQTEKGIYISYKFPTPEDELKCQVELGKINDTEVELNISPSSMSREVISKMKCTTDQTEALLLMCVPKLAKA